MSDLTVTAFVFSLATHVLDELRVGFVEAYGGATRIIVP